MLIGLMLIILFFIHILGIPSLDLRYNYEEVSTSNNYIINQTDDYILIYFNPYTEHWIVSTLCNFEIIIRLIELITMTELIFQLISTRFTRRIILCPISLTPVLFSIRRWLNSGWKSPEIWANQLFFHLTFIHILNIWQRVFNRWNCVTKTSYWLTVPLSVSFIRIIHLNRIKYSFNKCPDCNCRVFRIGHR